MKKIILVTLGVLLLSGCVQITALLGPAIIGGSSGSIYKASLHYGTGYIIKKSTGKTASEHAFGLLTGTNKDEKREKN